MGNKKKDEIALFRYGIIAPVIHENVQSQSKYFREVAGKEFDVPHIGRRRYKVSGLKSWLRKYKSGNIKALEPKVRKDKGTSRKISEEADIKIKEIINDYPELSCAGVFRLLFCSGHTRLDITEQTVRKYIKDNNLKDIAFPPMPRKKFEKEAANMLWITDFMHGPHIIEISSHLQLACARLRISLVHSKPYDSPSRGKIERFWRTVREKFLIVLNLKEIESLNDLNKLFDIWLSREYNGAIHTGIDAKPMDKYIASFKSTVIHRIYDHELDKAFLMTINRKVKNDSTISFGGKLFEVPTKYIGSIIEIRYAHDKQNEPVIYEKDEPVCKIKLINENENANIGTLGIRFSKEEI